MAVILPVLTLIAGAASGWALTQWFRPQSVLWRRVVLAVAIVLGVVVSFLTYYALYDLGLISPDAI